MPVPVPVADICFHKQAVWQSTARFRIIAGDESMPVILAAGQRWCKGRCCYLGHSQDRQCIRYSPRHPGKQLHRRTRSFSGKVQIKEGFQSDIFLLPSARYPNCNKTDKFASRHHPIEQTFFTRPVIKITDSGSQRSHRIRMCFLNPPFYPRSRISQRLSRRAVRCVSRLTLSSLKDKTDNIP